MKFRLKSLRTKLIILCLFILLVPTVVIGISTYQSSKAKLDEVGKSQLKQSVKSVIGMINVMNAQVEEGKLTLEDAQERVRQELLGKKNEKNARTIKPEYTVGKTGYPWAANKDAISVMNPSNEGTNLTDVKTEDGVMLGKEIVRIGTSGGGFLTYKWKLANSTVIESKISYVEMDSHWGWIVGSGAYLSEFNSGATHILNLVLLIGSIAILVGTVIAAFVSTRFTKPIQLIAKKLNIVATGDFTVEEAKVSSKDEVGELAKDFNNMIHNMKHFISEVHVSSQQVASSSSDLTTSAEQTSKATEQITIAIQDSANGAEEQQFALQRTTTSLEEISVGMQRIAESSSTIAESSADTRETADLGGIAVQNTVKQMNSISKSVNESDEVIKLLEQRTQQINEMLNVITDISTQTNLLALNAAIEAARAGEHGRGFSVVASEVRKLADQSNRSSGQISTLIEEMQRNMEQSIQTMGKVKSEVSAGLEIAKETELRFSDISTLTSQISQQTEDLASITQQISASVQEISASGENVTNIAKLASDNSQSIASAAEEQLASMEEVTGLSATLSHMAGDLQQLISKFKFK
ncbi:methyl-accepting chemotaxis protein [Paenibacillus sp. SYP-B3998]|uniref:Methyl-accepting chemotaxis protein n=1 Tax=Paenibacillus sp. SYP-B3998 TaxID=2678564 RepID=A0A6G3ZZ58_9BACL|nr:methyl-accepting chemotaxis protein [Paenibacillus sp. SYP-B3998]NEW07338.1 methyl-accepting chemotaxis protein [Paenibacillus sp. SYP-B3998]